MAAMLATGAGTAIRGFPQRAGGLLPMGAADRDATLAILINRMSEVLP